MTSMCMTGALKHFVWPIVSDCATIVVATLCNIVCWAFFLLLPFPTAPNSDEFFQMVANSQSRRLDDQRVYLRSMPGISPPSCCSQRNGKAVTPAEADPAKVRESSCLEGRVSHFSFCVIVGNYVIIHAIGNVLFFLFIFKYSIAVLQTLYYKKCQVQGPDMTVCDHKQFLTWLVT